jgi:hypothetical protein
VDPIIFDKLLLFSIEDGHGNAQSNDYSSVAYWYQREPHKKFPDSTMQTNEPHFWLIQFLAYNGFQFRMSQKQAEDFVVDVVNQKYEFDEVVAIIQEYSVKM